MRAGGQKEDFVTLDEVAIVPALRVHSLPGPRQLEGINLTWPGHELHAQGLTNASQRVSPVNGYV